MTQWRTYIQPPRQGLSHRKRGDTPCQDAAMIRENDSVIAAVVSDGLGQFAHSHVASAAIADGVSAWLLNCDYDRMTEPDLRRGILTAARSSIRQRAMEAQLSLSEMDGTLLFLVLRKEDGMLLMGQLGDGMICAVSCDRSFRANIADDHSGAAVNMTKTVLSRDGEEALELRRGSAGDMIGFFLMTDGLQNELYSRAGGIKKKIEWYFQLISNRTDEECFREIDGRWDELTEDESYGFIDDMTLAAIVLPGRTAELREEATWLCACGHRNRMESSRCEACGKDILRLYRGINFRKVSGSRLAFFLKINGDPQEEIRILKEHSDYPLEFEPAEPKIPYWRTLADKLQNKFNNLR